jgi:hypothetical protein
MDKLKFVLLDSMAGEGGCQRGEAGKFSEEERLNGLDQDFSLGGGGFLSPKTVLQYW